MTFHKDIIDLQEHLGATNSIGEIRNYLIKRDLQLVISIYTKGVHRLDWDITNKKICGVLDLSFAIKISKISDDDVSVESKALYPVRLDEIDWFDQKDLFETLKQGIKTCIKHIKNE